MIPYPQIDPVAIALGPLQIHWYGLAYLLSFILVWRLAVHRTKQAWSPLKKDQVEDALFYCAIGVILGGRFGYVFFYQFDRFLEEPLWLFKVWEGGMSFHGGAIGVIVAVIIFARMRQIPMFRLGDFVAPLVPVGLFLGRLGNFIGQELWGRPTTGWWAMVFPNDPEQLPRHPSQLYEAVLEGIVLFVILWILSKKQRPTGLITGVFLVGYGVFRFIVEFAREPDAHLMDSLLFGWLTRGQLLCLPMILAGSVFIVAAVYKGAKPNDQTGTAKPQRVSKKTKAKI